LLSQGWSHEKDRLTWGQTKPSRGGWAVAQIPILVTTVTLKRLAKHGYLAMFDYYLKVCPHYKSSPLFPYV